MEHALRSFCEPVCSVAIGDLTSNSAVEYSGLGVAKKFAVATNGFTSENRCVEYAIT
jgi:hypothetical protein